jgi:hypothetical protein
VVLDVSLRDKAINPDQKRINEFGKMTIYFILLQILGLRFYDLERLEFNDTYFIGDNAIEAESSLM